MGSARGGPRSTEIQNHPPGTFGFYEVPMPVQSRAVTEPELVVIDSMPEAGMPLILATLSSSSTLKEGDTVASTSWEELAKQAGEEGWSIAQVRIKEDNLLQFTSLDGLEILSFSDFGLLDMRISKSPDGDSGSIYVFFYERTEVDGPWKVTEVVEHTIPPKDED